MAGGTSWQGMQAAQRYERDAYERQYRSNKQMRDELFATAALALVSLDDYVEKKKEFSMTKDLAENYGFNFNKEFNTFTSTHTNKDGSVTPIEISLNDMNAYRKLSLRGEKNLKEILEKDVIVKQHTVSGDKLSDYIGEVTGYEENKWPFKKSGSKKHLARKGRLQSFVDTTKDPVTIADFQNSLSDIYDIKSHYDALKSGGSSELLDNINEKYSQTFGSLDEYFDAVKTGNIVSDLASYGRYGDKYIVMVDNELAHISEEELYLKKILGNKADEIIKAKGSGTINPDTGLKEYFWKDLIGGAGKLFKGGMKILGDNKEALGGIGAGLGIASTVLGMVDKHKAEKQRLSNINAEMAEIDNAVGEAGTSKIEGIEDILETAEASKDNMLGEAGGALSVDVANLQENIIKGGKGLVTGEQDLAVDRAKEDISGQVESNLANLELESSQAIDAEAKKADMEMADMRRKQEALERERSLIKTGWTHKLFG